MRSWGRGWGSRGVAVTAKVSEHQKLRLRRGAREKCAQEFGNQGIKAPTAPSGLG